MRTAGVDLATQPRKTGLAVLKWSEGRATAPWLDLGEYADVCRTSDDAFDAVVSAMVARAHALGQWHRPPDDSAGLATLEGWIVVPARALGALGGVEVA